MKLEKAPINWEKVLEKIFKHNAKHERGIMKITVLTLVTFLLGSAAFAADVAATAANTSTTTTSFYQKLKESPVGMTYVSSNSLPRLNNTAKVRAITSYNYFLPSYKIDKNHKIGLEAVTGTSKARYGEYDTIYYRSSITFNRYNILSEDKHGLGLSASVDYRIYPDADWKTKSNKTSHLRAKVRAAKSVGKLDLALSVYNYAKIFNEDDTLATAPKQAWYLVGVQNYNITDKFYAYAQEEYYHERTEGDTQKGAGLDVTLALGYTAGIFTVEPYVYGTAMSPHDGKTLNSKLAANLGYGIDLVASLF